MRILICSWGNICEPDLELSLIDMGHEVKVLKRKIENKDYDVAYLKFLSEELMVTSYDCVFSINYVPIISRVCNAHKIKYISWTVDSPLFQLNSDTVSNVCNYIFIFDYQLYSKFKHKSSHIYYMPLGANVKYFDRVIVAEEERVKYQAEVSFVGSLYEDKHQYDKVVLSDYLRGYLDGIIEAQSYIYGYNFLESMLSEEMVKEFCGAASWCGFGDD